MGVKNEKFLIQTNGFTDIIDITLNVNDAVKQSVKNAKDAGGDIKNAVIHIFSPGSTVSITTIEYEPGLIKDIPEILDDLIPAKKAYHHDKTWHDGNGYRSGCCGFSWRKNEEMKEPDGFRSAGPHIEWEKREGAAYGPEGTDPVCNGHGQQPV